MSYGTFKRTHSLNLPCFSLLLTFSFCITPLFKHSVLLLISTASLWLRVHKQTPPNVHRHERECRPQQQVQQFHQDTGDSGGPGHQLPDLCITGEEDSDMAQIPHSYQQPTRIKVKAFLVCERVPCYFHFYIWISKSKNIMSIIRYLCFQSYLYIYPGFIRHVQFCQPQLLFPRFHYKCCHVVVFAMWLQAGAWPLTHVPSSTFAIPQELEKSVQMVSRLSCSTAELSDVEVHAD